MDITIWKQEQDNLIMTQRLEQLIQSLFPEFRVRQVDSGEGLHCHLCFELKKMDVLICFIDDRHHVEFLLSLAPLFNNVRLVLIFKSRSKILMELGFRLTPSFICYQDEDFMGIISVLERIHRKKTRQNNFSVTM